MAKSNARLNIKLKSTESGHFYYTTKNKNNTPERIHLKKFDPYVKKHVLYKESR